MASTTTPNSLQIRLAFTPFNSTKVNPILFHTRFTSVDHRRRVRLLCIANHGNGSGSVPIRAGSDNHSVSEFKKNESYGGVVRVGVAGIFLLSGIAFAAFLVSRRNGQVKPLTTHQGLLLSSDDCNDKTEHVNADSTVEQGNINVEDQIHISRGCSSPESDKIPNCDRIVNDSDIESQLVHDIHNNIDDNANAIIYISVQEELQHGSVVDDGYVVPREGTVALNDPEPEIPIDSLDSYRFQDFDSSIAVDSDNSITELKENPSSIEPRNMSNIDAEPLPVMCEQQDGIIGSSGNRSSAISNTLRFVADDESILVNIDVSTQSNKTTSDPEVFAEEDDPSVSTKGNFDLNNMLQVLDKSSLEEQNFTENNLLTKSFVSSTHKSVDGQVRNVDNEVDKCRSESSNYRAFYSAPGIPAPSVVSAAVHVLPGKVLVPAVVDLGHGQALAVLQALKVIEPDVEPSDLCTRREYARWIVSATSALSRKTISKVFPAMYTENVTELAFDDITPEDPDFSSIQGQSRIFECRVLMQELVSTYDLFLAHHV